MSYAGIWFDLIWNLKFYLKIWLELIDHIWKFDLKWFDWYGNPLGFDLIWFECQNCDLNKPRHPNALFDFPEEKEKFILLSQKSRVEIKNYIFS